jgi:uncharacterized protein
MTQPNKHSYDPGAKGTKAGLTRHQCFALLREADTGRVVYTDQALPALTVVRYVVDAEDAVIARASPGSPLRWLDGAVVAFEADRLGNGGPRPWSVTVVGRAELMSAAGADGGSRVGHGPDRYLRIPADLVRGAWIDH